MDPAVHILSTEQLANELTQIFAWQTDPATGASDRGIFPIRDSNALCPSWDFLTRIWPPYWRIRKFELRLDYEPEKTDCDDFAETARVEMLHCHRLNAQRRCGLACYPVCIRIHDAPLNGIQPCKHFTDFIRASNRSSAPLANWIAWEPQNENWTSLDAVAASRRVHLLHAVL